MIFFIVIQSYNYLLIFTKMKLKKSKVYVQKKIRKGACKLQCDCGSGEF